MPGLVTAAARARAMARFRAALEPLRREATASWSGWRQVIARHGVEPLLVLLGPDGEAALLSGGDGPPLRTTLTAWRVTMARGRLLLEGPGERLGEVRALSPWIIDTQDGELVADRRGTHALAVALERATSATPAQCPLLVVDRLLGASPAEAPVMLGMFVGAAAWLSASKAGPWGSLASSAPWTALVFGAMALTALVLWAWRETCARDGLVELHEDRLVVASDRLVVARWSEVRGYDDRRAAFVRLGLPGLVTIPTPDEATRTAVLAFLDARGLRRAA